MRYVVRFTVPGKPMGKERVRITRDGHAYTPQRTVNYESRVALAAQQAVDGRPIFTCPVEVYVNAHFEVPKSWPQKKRTWALSGITKPTGKPDLDNMLKAICDGMNGVVFVDDAQVVRCIVEKRYGEQPCVHVTVTPMESTDGED